VQLNNQYQRGIDWSRLRSGAAGFQILQSSVGTPVLPGAFSTTSSFIIAYATPGLNFAAAINLLETFGSVRVLSSPKLGVMNNQTALLRVTRDIVYFTITPSTTPITIAGGSGNLAVQQAFTTTPQVAAEGFMMAVLPQISDVDSVVLSVRPTIRRRITDASDPNPALTRPNLIPVFETREFDSILRVQSGQIAVLGGLMQDSAGTVEDMIPGVRDIPALGELLAQRRDLNQKTELVIFLRATVVRDPSVDGDLRALRGLLPGDDFLSQPNPGRVEPSIGPSGQPLR
jgi:general secretion pathway protein D